MLRILKQLLYGFFFLAVFYGIGFGAYRIFVKPVPSCVDHIQNQGEEGIDCGPTCGSFCLPKDLKEIEVVGPVMLFHPRADRVAVLAKIQNPNGDLGVTALPYHITFFNDAGAILRTIRGESFIAPREIKYVTEFPEGTGLELASRAEIKFGEHAWVRGSDAPHFAVSVQRYGPRVEGKEIIVEGKVKNDDTIAASSVTVLVFFYGELGQIAGVSKSVLFNVAPGEARAFTVNYPLFPNANPSRVEVFATGRRS